MTVVDMIEKRKTRWRERTDLEYDRKLVRAAVVKLLGNEALRQEVVERPYLLIELAFLIVDKKKKTVPFFFNEVQADFIRRFEEHGTGKPYYVLKGRQQGFTSLITAMQLSFAIVRKNFSGFTLADKSDNTLSIFNDKARVVYERLPEELKPTEKFASKRELFFDVLNSSWRIATASSQVGRSRTLSFVHFSEIAFYECSLSDLQKGIGEAMTEEAVCVYETTANGFNEAKELWDSGTCINLFTSGGARPNTDARSTGTWKPMIRGCAPVSGFSRSWGWSGSRSRGIAASMIPISTKTRSSRSIPARPRKPLYRAAVVCLIRSESPNT